MKSLPNPRHHPHAHSVLFLQILLGLLFCAPYGYAQNQVNDSHFGVKGQSASNPFLVLALLGHDTVVAQEQYKRAPKPDRKWQIGLGLQGFGSIFTHGSITNSNGIETWDKWAAGAGGDIYFRYLLLSQKNNNKLFSELGAGFYSARGLYILGTVIPGTGGRQELLGRYKNQTITIPGRLTYHFAARNTLWSIQAGIEWVAFPVSLNSGMLRADFGRPFGPEKRLYNWNHILRIGLVINNTKWLDEVSFMYRRSIWDFLGNDHRILGIQLNWHLPL